MAQLQKLEIQMDIKSSGARFFQVFRSQLHLLPKLCPEIVKDIKVIKGDWESIGSIRQWSYVAAGGSDVAKEEVVAVDDGNKDITVRVNSEAINKNYKTLQSKIQVNGSSVKWAVEYEKQNDNVPPPTKYMELVPIFIKKVDEYLSKNA